MEAIVMIIGHHRSSPSLALDAAAITLGRRLARPLPDDHRRWSPHPPSLRKESIHAVRLTVPRPRSRRRAAESASRSSGSIGAGAAHDRAAVRRSVRRSLAHGPRGREPRQRRGRPPARRMRRRRPRAEPRSDGVGFAPSRRRHDLGRGDRRRLLGPRPDRPLHGRCGTGPSSTVPSCGDAWDASRVARRDAGLGAGRDGLGRRRDQVFAIFPDGSSGTATGTARWHAWESLGGELTGTPAASSWGADRIDVFAPGPRRRDLAPLVGRHALGRVGAAPPLSPAGRV